MAQTTGSESDGMNPHLRQSLTSDPSAAFAYRSGSIIEREMDEAATLCKRLYWESYVSMPIKRHPAGRFARLHAEKFALKRSDWCNC